MEEIELFDEVAEVEIVAETETSTESVAELTAAPMEEFAAEEEAEVVEEAWNFADVAVENVMTADQESPEVVVEDDVSTSEVAEVAEEDEGSNWFDIGDDKDEDEDDPELRKFLKGF